ncbi:DNA polymerase V, partial [Escherichia coli O28/42:H37]
STSKTPSYTKSVSWQHHRRRIVKTADFVQELLKVSWDFSMEEANLWIARYTTCFKDITPDHGENKTWFMYNPNGGL